MMIMLIYLILHIEYLKEIQELTASYVFEGHVYLALL